MLILSILRDLIIDLQIIWEWIKLYGDFVSITHRMTWSHPMSKTLDNPNFQRMKTNVLFIFACLIILISACQKDPGASFMYY
jgi:hypothetical protein